MKIGKAIGPGSEIMFLIFFQVIVNEMNIVRTFWSCVFFSREKDLFSAGRGREQCNFDRTRQRAEL